MGKKIAVLSNVNMNYVIRLLKKDHQVYEAEGYGNELGILMNEQSSYHAFAPEITFLLMDLMELLGHELYLPKVREDQLCIDAPRLHDWFEQMERCILPGGLYYLSDAWLWGPEIGALPESSLRQQLEEQWLRGLVWLRQRH